MYQLPGTPPPPRPRTLFQSFPARLGLHRLAQCLTENTGSPDDAFICQFSSLGSFQEDWLDKQFGLAAGGLRPILVYPTVEEVRASLEGWAAGESIPVRSNNLKPFIRARLHRWGSDSLRAIAMPHIKTYVRYDRASLAIRYLVMGSHNLSKAAWGEDLKNGKYQIRSYELSVVLQASVLAKREPCTTSRFAWRRCEKSDTALRVEQLPYSLRPTPYTAADEPWAVDVPRGDRRDAVGRTHRDVFGR